MTDEEAIMRDRVLAGEAVPARMPRKSDPGHKALIAWAQAEDRFVYIGRQRGPKMWVGGYYLHRSEWANPYKVGEDGDRETVIRRYTQTLSPELRAPAKLGELRGELLGCWCAPLPCHGDVLAAMVASLATEQEEA